jgi:beta-catenin-like protein 1
VQGVELMWIMLCGRKQCRYGALKLLDYASTRAVLPCEKLVDLVSVELPLEEGGAW